MTDVSLGALVKNAAERMALEIERLRLATPHRGLKGDGAERIVQEFLADRFPASLGVTTGHVVDAAGKISKQADVIVYDALRTPILFKAALNGFDVVPVEGVVAVIEVKMHLTASHLAGVVANAASVFALERKAYIGDPVAKYIVGDSITSEPAIYYSLFAFESDSMYASELNSLMSGVPVPERIASVCYMDRGVSLHVDVSPAGGSFSASPTSLALFDADTPHSLMNWFGALSSVVFQAGGRPIDLLKYAAADPSVTALSGTLPGSGPHLAQKAGEKLFASLGMDPAIAAAVLGGQPLSPTQIAQIQQAGGVVELKPDGTAGLTLPVEDP